MIETERLVLRGLTPDDAEALALRGEVLLQEGKLDEAQLRSYETAVRYQMFHGVALLIVGLMRVPRGWNSANAAGLLFAIGVLLFSGGIYAWIFTGQKAFVHLVPIGGILWLCGWLSLAWAGCLCPKCKDVLGERE